MITYTLEERQQAFADGIKYGLDRGKWLAECAVTDAIDEAFFKLGEKNTFDEVRKNALAFIYKSFEEAKP
jgi:hypothetical protein